MDRRTRAAAVAVEVWVAIGLGGCVESSSSGGAPGDVPEAPWVQEAAPSVPGVPAAAEMAADGCGDVRWEAPRPGRVWVANVSRGYVVVSEDVSRGDTVKVFPSKDRVEIAGRAAYSQNLESKDRHAVFFRDRVIGPRGGGGGGGWGGPGTYGSIPRGAERVASGVGQFSWRAESGGTIWLGDDRTKTVILTQAVRARDLVEVDAKSDFVRVNGRGVYSQNLESRHTLSIFWR